LDFFICAARHNVVCVQRTQHHLTVRSTSLPLAAQMNDVAPLVQMMCFAMMWATPNDVALRANGIRPFTLCAEI